MQTVHNLIILDASGSMSLIYNQALGGLNETLQSIKIAQKETPELRQVVTLASFSSGHNHLKVIYKNMPIEEIHELTHEDYSPYGGTALYDAIGEMTYMLKGLLDKDTRALVTIITDGEENSSHNFRGQQIRNLINDLREQNWMFTYIGANQDVEAVAAEMGIHSSMRYESSEEGTERMFERERKSRRNFIDKLAKNFKLNAMACEDTFFDDEEEDK